LTTIYFLLSDDAVSRWHRVTSDEVWHLYEGGPLEILELNWDDREVRRHVLAPVGGDGERPVHVVAAGLWQAARVLGPYALVGCTVGPGFEFADFDLLADDAARATAVRRDWPDLAELV
jgi:uncharacterized protein